MSLGANLLEQLLYEEEGHTLDFKRAQYPFEGADSNTKSELLKDILAFANAWRQATAYVLIGVDEAKGGRSQIVGVETHLDDAKLHQFVNSKTQRPVDFSYYPVRTEDVEIGVIEIPLQTRPIYLVKPFGKLNPNIVYKRDGSSTAIALPDEVARMGAVQVSVEIPGLILEWANIERRVILPSPCDLYSLILEPLLPDDTFEKQKRRSPYSFSLNDYGWNENYFREMILYTFEMNFLKPLSLRLCNRSGIVARRVRFVGSITKESTVFVTDNPPARPYRNHMDGINESIVPLASQLKSNPDPCVRELDERWEITIDFGDVRPREEIWTTSPLFIGSRGGIIKLEGKLLGDNIPKPVPCALEVRFEVKKRPMERTDVESYLR